MGMTYLGGNKKVKAYLGSTPIYRMYLGNERIHPNASAVTYYVDSGTVYTEEIDIDESCLTPTSFTPEKSGYDFIGWREDTEANSSVLSEKISTGDDVTLYAVFRQVVAVYYNGNGNTGGSTAAQSGYRYYNNGNTVNPSFNLSANGFSRTNYMFAGWRQGSTSGTICSVGSTVTLSASTTFYARWVQKVYNYGYTGGMQSFAVPVTGVYRFQVYGAQGGDSSYGGKGGYANGYKQLSAGQTIYICVGGAGKSASSTNIAGGYNGGGTGQAENGTSGSGGGCTHIATRSGTLQALGNTSGLYIVAGGGGGFRNDWQAPGGAGGGTTGSDAGVVSGVTNGKGGTQSSGGTGDYSCTTFGKGGTSRNFGGGGGGGLYGGGGGYGAGGGGGSGYTGGVPSFSYGGTTYSPSMSNGQRSGNGYATITLERYISG